MSLGDRIESRRLALGISQAELARRVGMRQSTMNSLVNGNSRTTRYLVPLARELRTTPAFLVEETDDPEAESPDQNFTSGELELIGLVRALGSKDRAAIEQLVRTIATSAAVSTPHDKRPDFRGDD